MPEILAAAKVNQQVFFRWIPLRADDPRASWEFSSRLSAAIAAWLNERAIDQLAANPELLTPYQADRLRVILKHGVDQT